MNELIRIETREDGERFVDARELHTFLGVKKQFTDWIEPKINDYGFAINSDFYPSKCVAENGRVMETYDISIDMAKELSMISKTEKGKQARQYFIACEKIAKASMEQNIQVALLPEQRHALRLQNIREQMNLLNELCSLDDRDRMDLSDAVRNTGQHLLPARTDVALPVTISGRAIDLGIKLDRKDAIRVGKITARLYREKHDKNPVKHTQYVDGAARHVNSYTEDDLDIIDEAINGIL